MKKLFLSLAMLSCLLAPAPAGGGQTTEQRGMYPRPTLEDSKYYVCKEDKHCTTASMPCGRVIVLSVLFQKEVQGWADFVAPRYKCLATVPRQKAENIACVEGMCRGDISQVSQQLEDKPWHHNKSWCETIDDCAVVSGPCYKKLIVNKRHKDQLQAEYDNIRFMNMERCLIPDKRTVERLHCRNNTCEADLKIPDQSDWNAPVDMRKPRKPD